MKRIFILIVICGLVNINVSAQTNSDIITVGNITDKSETRRNIVPQVEVIEYIGNPLRYEGTITTILYQLENPKKDPTKIIKPHLYSAALTADTNIVTELLPENVPVVKVRQKGKKVIVQVDVSKYNIAFPPEGVFVGLEYVGITDNTPKNSDALITIWNDRLNNHTSVSRSKYKGEFDKEKNPMMLCFGIKILQKKNTIKK